MRILRRSEQRYSIESQIILEGEDTNLLKPVNLKCEFIDNPAGIDLENPRLSWNIDISDSNRRGINQTAYQILVATSPEKLTKDEGDIWNSGKVLSEQMSQIKFAGDLLRSSRKYWWKVRAWNQRDDHSDWSEPAFWIMGILGDSDWDAIWISARGAEKYALSYEWSKRDLDKEKVYSEPQPDAPTPEDPNFSSMLLRHEFEVQPELSMAVIHISGLGHYELSLNGSKVGNCLLTPGWTDYKKTVLYDTYDVTNQLQSGRNAFGILLGNGMYNIQPHPERYVKFINTYGSLKAIAQLHLSYSDGSEQIICTDDTWKISTGPITFSNVFAGEDYDANLVPGGWNATDFQAGDQWANAVETKGPGGELKGVAHAAPPIKAIETLTPPEVIQMSSNTTVYDLGQNASIMPKIRISGPKGSSVRITPAEVLNPDGTIDRRSVTQEGDGTLGETEETRNSKRPAWWQYTLKGIDSEEWLPKFFYHGARYLKVELFPADKDGDLPRVEDVSGVVVHASTDPVGKFSCSNDLFNRIYELVRWAQRSNMMSVLTDCPHRERLSWLEQYHLNGPSLRYNFDLTTLLRKSMNDMSDSQHANGFVPNIAPEYFIAGSPELTNGFRNSPEWGSAFVIVPWQQYLFAGDLSLLEQHYPDMKRYVAFLKGTAENHIITTGLGDWYDLGPEDPWGSQLTPEPLTATAIYYYDNWILARTAELLERPGDAEKYGALASEIRHAFNEEFYNPESGHYAANSQTANAIPLVLNIVEPPHRDKVARALVEDIRSRGYALTSGDVGYRFLLKALASEGYSDVIYEMNNQQDRPGYGYQLKMGATSLTEKWDASVGYLGSQNHFMLGQINEWLFSDLVGIDIYPDGAGFRKFVIKPMVIDDLDWVKGSYKSVSGLITSEWKYNTDEFSLHLKIPANTTAIVYIPADDEKSVKESGQRACDARGLTFLEMKPERAVFEVESGSYEFFSEFR